MSITRAKQSSFRTGVTKYDTFLAGLPFTPTVGTATDGGTGSTASVTFTGNNTAGLTYTALSTPGSLTGTSLTSPITVSGLTSGTAYTFQVKATNSAGDSAYSSASNSVTPVTPTAFDSIATTTVGAGGVSSVTFSSIPSTYKHLQIRMLAKNATATGVRDAYIQVNGDTGANYSRHWVYDFDGSGTPGALGGSSLNYYGYGYMAGTTTGTNVFTATIVDILDYANTNKNKTFRTFTGNDKDSGGNAVILMTSGGWYNTNAINSITIQPTSGNISQYSTFALYGIKGA